MEYIPSVHQIFRYLAPAPHSKRNWHPFAFQLCQRLTSFIYFLCLLTVPRTRASLHNCFHSKHTDVISNYSHENRNAMAYGRSHDTRRSHMRPKIWWFDRNAHINKNKNSSRTLLSRYVAHQLTLLGMCWLGRVGHCVVTQRIGRHCLHRTGVWLCLCVCFVYRMIILSLIIGYTLGQQFAIVHNTRTYRETHIAHGTWANCLPLTMKAKWHIKTSLCGIATAKLYAS